MKQSISLITALAFITTLLTLSGSAAAQSSAVVHGLRLHQHLKNGTSTNWSGYAVATNLKTPANNAVSNVSGSWVVPKVVCPARSTSYSSSWVGIDGYSDSTVEQTGTEQDCQRGQAVYSAWYEFYPQSELSINSLAVHPGDTMSGTVTFAGNNNFTVTILDQTSHRSFSITRRINGTLRQSAEWVAEAPSSWFGVLPLADFGTTGFTGATATLNGHAGTITDPTWQNDPLTMVTTGGLPRATLSGLTADGGGFNVTWQHN